MGDSTDRKNFLFVSLSGLIGDIAWQVLKEGHGVRYFIEAERERDIADGFVPKSTNWEADLPWADVVVFDDTLGQGAKAQATQNHPDFVGDGNAQCFGNAHANHGNGDDVSFVSRKHHSSLRLKTLPRKGIQFSHS